MREADGSHTALRALNRASPSEPFIQCLIARTYEAMGDRAQAIECYRKAAAATAHSVPTAFAQPFARGKPAFWIIVRP